MSVVLGSCHECGARLKVQATHCTLCGWPVQKAEDADDRIAAEDAAGAADAQGARPSFCNSCGWKNPDGARYCSRCGERLQAIEAVSSLKKAALPPSKPPSPVAPTPPAKRNAPAREVAIVVGAALALVVTTFLVTDTSRRTHPSTPTTADPVAAGVVTNLAPVTGTLAEQIAVLDGQIANESGPTRIARQREKAFLLMQADRLDLAAVEYGAVAQATGAVEDWRITGDLHYDWMTREEDDARRSAIAAQAIAAYEEVLALTPDNHDVRTDLATAYLNTGNPMKGVTAIKHVLQADPNHLDANFNYGLMLWRIGRLEQAAVQFEKVMGLIPEDSEHHTRAKDALTRLRQESSI